VDFTPAQGGSSSWRVVQVRFGSNADTSSKNQRLGPLHWIAAINPVLYHSCRQREDNMTKRPMYLQHVNVYVRNVERSKKWYEDLLGLHVYEYRPGWAAFLTADKEQSHEVALMQLGEDAPLQLKRQVGLNHMAWRLESLDDLKEFYKKIKAEGQPIDHISDHGISLGIYLRDPDGNGVEVFYEMPRAEWPVDYNVFTREKTGSGRFPGPWDAEIGRDGSPARRQAAAE
jgi:catechol 2,3-dioxygenase